MHWKKNVIYVYSGGLDGCWGSASYSIAGGFYRRRRCAHFHIYGLNRRPCPEICPLRITPIHLNTHFPGQYFPLNFSYFKYSSRGWFV